MTLVAPGRVAVGLSGGVDSAVAAALLAEAGHDVVGLTLKIWDRSRCCSLEDAEDARRVARHLGIPFYVLDAHDAFEAEVVAPFVEAYRAGLTPNPCVVCNRRVKFGWLLDRARTLGCEALATGHYARLEGGAGARRLLRGVDGKKDQSYFLVPEEASVLDRLLFPLGGLTKDEVRRLAAERGLPVAAKGESQDLCFLPDGDLGAFLGARLGAAGASLSGDIVDTAGRVLGRHGGVHAFTVGQRKGLGLASPEPLYVLRRDAAANRLVVGRREELLARELRARDPVWLTELPASIAAPGGVARFATAGRSPGLLNPSPAQTVLDAESFTARGPASLSWCGRPPAHNRATPPPLTPLVGAPGLPPSGRCRVKIRSTARAVGCRVAPDPAGGPRFRVELDEPQFGVAPGQLAVFYDGDLVLGGAWIDEG